MPRNHSKHTRINKDSNHVTSNEMLSEQAVDLIDRPNDMDKKQPSISGLHSIGLDSPMMLVVSILLLIAAFIVPFEGWMKTVFCLIPYLIAAYDIVFRIYEHILKKEYLSQELTVLLASIILFCLACYYESIILLIIFRLGILLEKYVERECTKELSSLPDILPKYASVETPEGLLNVEPEYVNVGDIICISEGEIIPLDGVIIEGITSIDTSAISGQVKNWDIGEGYRVYSGCRNISSSIRVRVTKTFEQSAASRIVRMSEKAVTYKASQQSFTEKLCKVFTPLAFILSIAIALFPTVNAQWSEYLKRAAMLLIMASPSAMQVSVALAYMKGLGVLSAGGIFSKGLDCIESIAQSETVIFDKTGTVTEGRYAITDIFTVGISENELLRYAGSAEIFSRHPIASALREAAGINRKQNIKVVKVEEIPGRGVSAFVNNAHVYCGNAALLEEHGINCRIPERSGAAIHVAIDNQYRGYIQVADRIRGGAFDSLENLRVHGVKKTVLLTGDVISVARPIASKLNFDMLRAELTPEGKLNAISYLMANKGRRSAVTFIGDGYNDSELMAKVDVGISMGSLGSEAAFSSADVLVMDKDIRRIPKAFAVSRATVLVVIENIVASSLITILSCVLATLGLISCRVIMLIYAIQKAALLINAMRLKQ